MAEQPYSVREIEEETPPGTVKPSEYCGPVYNHPYGLVWVDIDGPSVYKLIEEVLEQTSQLHAQHPDSSQW